MPRPSPAYFLLLPALLSVFRGFETASDNAAMTKPRNSENLIMSRSVKKSDRQAEISIVAGAVFSEARAFFGVAGASGSVTRMHFCRFLAVIRS